MLTAAAQPGVSSSPPSCAGTRGGDRPPPLLCPVSHPHASNALPLLGGVGNNPSFCLMCVCVFKCL